MPDQSRKDALHRTIGEQLLADIADNRFPELPSIQQLMRHYQVGCTTMWKAVRYCADKGALDVQKGKKIRLRGTQQYSSWDLLYRQLQLRIADGSFRPGRPLPKYAYLQREFRVSADTVVAALNRAARDGLIYKSGKQWLVGAPRRHAAGGHVQRTRIVMVLIANRLNWFELNENSFVRPFTSALLGEFRDAGVHVQLAIQRLDSRVASVPTGMQETLAFIRGLGEMYAGVLAYLQSPERTVGKWVNALCRFRKPVVVFDNSNSLAALTRRNIDAGEFYYRCFFNEPTAIALAIDTLRELGHRRIGMFYTAGNVAWMRRRIDMIERTAARIAPEMTFFRACLEDAFGVFDDDRSRRSRRLDDPHDIDSFLMKLTSPGSSLRDDRPFRRKDPPQRAVWEKTRSLRELLQTHQTTAWIAPNDFYERKIYAWATYVGLRVPEDISIISFDNASDSYLFPLASIDPGFAYLGYLAAHALIGDITVPADAGGHIAGQCRLVDRGSLGSPCRALPGLPR
jgi:DNA-binding LacI/PurR family transcriptional regulator